MCVSHDTSIYLGKSFDRCRQAYNGIGTGPHNLMHRAIMRPMKELATIDYSRFGTGHTNAG